MKAKQDERARKIEAGDKVSDTSSVKEKKKKDKDEMISKIRKKSTM